MRITLTISDELGRAQPVVIAVTRFTIGSDADNDLVIDGTGVSRRHALIENFESIVHLTDCGSETGTFVNDKRINGGAVLCDGDRITIGPARNLRVSLNRPRPESSHAAAKSAAPLGQSSRQAPAANRRFSTPGIALAAVALILIVAVPLIALLSPDGGRRERRPVSSRDQDKRDEGKPPPGPRPQDERGQPANGESPPLPLTVEQVEKAAAQFMRRISSDDRPYVFAPYAVNGLEDIKRRVEQLAASPALVGALNSINTAGPAIAAEARREGIEPGLVIFTSLAETEGGRVAGDQMLITRRVLPELLSLKKTLGTESADKSLILVAAYRMGGGTKKSHPLLGTMRRVVRNPLTDRNVWFLREHGGLDDRAYNFVVSFLALGVIAESPRRFGVKAPPVAY
jgi:pSer/pThr/pTyr-binding forkhead associated (FHA) protein